uniref:Uncharacterized protein n=1 Tax=Avena sativa TaxID=4498 RepID=A0ACD5TV92_AVESA
MAMAASAEAKSRRFALACGVLSQYVKAEQKMSSLAAPAPRAPVATTLSLMPGADVAQEEQQAAAAATEEAGPATAQAQAPAPLTIFYGGRMVVFEDFPAEKAAEVMRMAAIAGAERAAAPAPAVAPAPALADMPIMRKASLQRFFEKRKDRLGARATPYARPAVEAAAKNSGEEKSSSSSSSSWLGLASTEDARLAFAL